ncbi:putative nitrate transporter 1.3-like [Capsicum annuum]|nr:putative nitrate transporter 1.3-like [Capsicum annuum]KAF3621651.1 putative nitrate transporter 1.3-like [Capsicum annuum]
MKKSAGKPSKYDLEYRNRGDDAWYGVLVILTGETMTVKFEGYPDTFDVKFDAKEFKSKEEIDDFLGRFRNISPQMQDNECGSIKEGMFVCAACSAFGGDDMLFYDAVVEADNECNSINEGMIVCAACSAFGGDDMLFYDAVVEAGETMTVKFEGSPDTFDVKFDAKEFKSKKEIGDFVGWFRNISLQMQDNECGSIREGMSVSAACSTFGGDDMLFYDAVVEAGMGQNYEVLVNPYLKAYIHLRLMNEFRLISSCCGQVTELRLKKNEFWLVRIGIAKTQLELELAVLGEMPYDKTCYALWQNLATTYGKPLRACIMSLKEDLNIIQKGNPSVTVYLQKIKEICAKLASVTFYISADEVFLHGVHGLPSEYDSIASALRARETTITFQELLEKLIDFEAYLTRRSS